MKITSTMEFGRTIRNKRKKLGYTQAQLSEYTGFSTSFISDLENGKETAEPLRCRAAAQTPILRIA